MKNLTIALMIGSIRKERASDRPAKALISMLKERGITPVVLDLQELDLPMFDDGITHDGRTKLLEAYKTMDGMIVVSPEYNHSMPASVKNAIDYAREKELSGKPLSIVTTSMGGWGGARALGGIRQAWMGVGGIVVPAIMQTPMVREFNVEQPSEIWTKTATGFLDRSIEWFTIIKNGKASLT